MALEGVMQERVLKALGAAAVMLLCMQIIQSLPGKKLSTGVEEDILANSGDGLDCYGAEQAWPIFANKMEGLKHPFIMSMEDKSLIPVQEMLESKAWGALGVSRMIQSVLSTEVEDPSQSAVVDVGANVGWTVFAASAMGFNVLAIEPVEENVRRLCDGVYLNRAHSRVKILHAAASDSPGTITIHKVQGRLDNTAVSSSGATANVQGEVIAVTVPTLTIDSIVHDHLHVSLVKIDVQGWEYHVLKGAAKLLSRPADSAPYLVYEEDPKLLQLSNTSAEQVAKLVNEYGYTECVYVDGDKHCSKQPQVHFSWMKKEFV